MYYLIQTVAIAVSRLLLACLVSAFVPIVAHGQWRDSSEVDACAEQLEQRTAALLARDWLQLEILAKRYLHTCSGVVGSEKLADAHWSIAVAKLEAGQYPESLRASDDCIQVFNSNPGCHLAKTEALVGLKRLNEARAALEMTERLTEHLIESAERDHSVAQGAGEEMYQARLNEFRGLLRGAEQIRMRYFYFAPTRSNNR
ncbi:MAG TPA: hypothetical protein VJ323_02745 [Bryobacteraceae bacterium]|nr:hypothetical protein [Bryobacteraceae bacterium]